MKIINLLDYFKIEEIPNLYHLLSLIGDNFTVEEDFIRFFFGKRFDGIYQVSINTKTNMMYYK